MPASKKRSKRNRPSGKKRVNKNAEARARKTQSAQEIAARKKGRSPASVRARKIVGVSLLGLAAVVAGTHLLEHLQVIEFAPQGIEDLVAGYPMAALLAIVGAIVLGS